MTSGRWNRVREIFAAALEKPSPDRFPFVEAEAGADRDLAREVHSLLEQSEKLGTLLDPAAGSRLPERLGRYRILDVLGRGGMGIVFLAEQPNPRRKVALKVLHPLGLTESSIRRFELEAAVLARLHHPGIAQIFEAGTTWEGGVERPFLAMELVEGEELTAYSESAALGRRRRVELFLRVCQAVQHAHQRGVIHRDVKPANIVVQADGEPKVLDFGIARVTDSEARLTLADADARVLMGTLPYMSPEQVAGDPGDVDTRADVYGLGVVLYELLTGRLPHEEHDRTPAQLIRAISEAPPTPPSRFDRALAGDLEIILLKALEKDRERRYGSAADLAADLGRWLRGEPIAARPPSLPYRLGKLVRRNKLPAAAAAAAGVVLIAATVLTANAALFAFEQQDLFRREARRAEAASRHLMDIITSVQPEAAGPGATIREALELTEGRVGQADLEDPELEVAVRQARAVAWLSLGEHGKARSHVDRALQIARTIYPQGHRVRLRLENDLGQVLAEAGDPVGAERTYRAVLREQERLLGPEDPDSLRTLRNLAGVVRELGRPDEALELLRLSQERHARSPGAARRDLHVLDNLMLTVLVERADFGEAVRFGGGKLAELRELRGDDDPVTRDVLRNLCAALVKARRWDEADRLTQESLAGDARVFGPDHRSTIVSRNNRVAFLNGAGMWAEARDLCREMIAISERVNGPDHVDTARARFNLAVPLFALGDAAAAEKKLSRALGTVRDVLGPGHEQTLLVSTELAKAWDALGRGGEAVDLLFGALDASEGLGPEHPSRLRCRAYIGEIMARQGDREGEEILRQAAEDMKRVLGPDDPRTVRAWQGWKLVAGSPEVAGE